MRFYGFSFLLPRRGAVLIAGAALGGVGLLSGCGGGGSNNSSNAQVRTIDASANGGTATISVNGSQLGGNQGYFGVTSYQGEAAGSDSITFHLGAASSTSYPALTQNFLTGSYYSLILVGRSDVTSATDPRYPSIIAIQDSFNSSFTTQAAVRIVYAAPDAGPVDVLINGTLAASGAAYKSVSGLFSEQSGNVTIQVNQSGTGTVLVPAQTIGLSSGQVYTIFVVEPTVSPTPGYGLQEIDDSTST